MEDDGDEWIPMDLHTASALGDCDTIKYLLDRGEDVNSVGVGGWSPLMYSCYFLSLEACQILIARGAHLGQKQPTLDHPNLVMLAAGDAHLPLVKLFFDPRTVGEKDAGGRTALFYAVDSSEASVVDFLLQNGSDPNVLAGGISPLMLAAINGFSAIAELLIAHRAEIKLTGRDGKTARDLAHEHGHQQFVEMLDRYDVPDLETLLTQLGLEKYWIYFKSNSVDMDKFMDMTEDDLKKIGIKLFGPRRKMSMMIAKLKPIYKKVQTDISKV